MKVAALPAETAGGVSANCSWSNVGYGWSYCGGESLDPLAATAVPEIASKRKIYL